MHVLERKRHLGFRFRCRGAAKAAATHSAEQGFKEIAEATNSASARPRATTGSRPRTAAGIAKHFTEIKSFPIRGRGEFRSTLPVGAQLIVSFALFGVAQDLVGFLRLLELLFRLLVVR